MIARKLPRAPGSVRRRLGPRDEGRLLTEEEYLRCQDAGGWVSELVDGVVRMSPSAKPMHSSWQTAVYDALRAFAKSHPGVVNYVAMANDVVIPGRPGPTRPRPDVSAYQNFPRRAELREEDDWRQFSPVLVVEVISGRRRRKDTLRNRNLYWQAASIAEYWVLDPRKAPHQPVLRVYAREGGQSDWTEYEVPFGETWKSALIAGLSVNLLDLGDAL